jgi:hypothetical protein
MGIAQYPVKQIKDLFCKFYVTFLVDKGATTPRGGIFREKNGPLGVFRGKNAKAEAGAGGANIFLTRKFPRGPGFSEEKPRRQKIPSTEKTRSSQGAKGVRREYNGRRDALTPRGMSPERGEGTPPPKAKEKGGRVAAAARGIFSGAGRKAGPQNFMRMPPWIFQRVSELLTTIWEVEGMTTLPLASSVTVGLTRPAAS